MFKLDKLKKRIVSLLSAVALFAGSFAEYMPVYAEGEQLAHTVNIFALDVKSGADYYSEYTPEDPAAGQTTSLSNSYVWKADKSNEGHKFVYNIKFSISGAGTGDKPIGMSDEEFERQQAFVAEEKFIQIRIPAHIFKFRDQTESGVADSNGVYPDSVEMPVPSKDQVPYTIVDGKKVYSSNHQFVYEYDEAADEYVIYNIQPVSSGVVYELPVAYMLNKNTWEYKDLEASDECQAKLEIKSWKKDTVPDIEHPEYINTETKKIPLYIDTNAKIKSTKKTVGSDLMTAEDAQKLTGITGLSDDYRYVLWNINSEISNVTQKYDIEITDTLGSITGKDANKNTHTVNGEVCAVKLSGSKNFVDASTEGYNKAVDLTSSGKRTDLVLAKYPYDPAGDAEGIKDLEEAERDGKYQGTNDASVTVTPSDKQDAPTVEKGNATMVLNYKDPSWKPVEEKYTSVKNGIYNKNKKVSSKDNISSFDLSDLAEGNDIDGLKYRTETTAHAYGKTIADLNTEIKALNVDINESDGTAVVVAGVRRYIFNINDTEHYTLEIYADKELSTLVTTLDRTVRDVTVSKLDKVEVQRIVGQDLADSFFGQKSLSYVLRDSTAELVDIKDTSSVVPLDTNDYCITSVGYKYTVRSASYVHDDMEFVEGSENEYNSEDNNLLEFWLYTANNDQPVCAAQYDVRTGEKAINYPALVQSVSDSDIVFADGAQITGYEIRTQNKYFYVGLVTEPVLTLKASDKVTAYANNIINNAKEKKMALRNTAKWSVSHEDGSSLYDQSISGTDYIAEVVRDSSISKKALGEKVTLKGRDGNTYVSSNDTLHGQYQLAWQVQVSELVSGVEVDGEIKYNQPVEQQSGIFYDLLPSHCDIIEGSVNVYVDKSGDVSDKTTPLASSAFEVLSRIDNYHGSGKKLLVIKINAPCSKSYTVTYVTVHSHDDIQDYGSIVLNTAAYQTGNADIAKGYPDNGGNYAVSMSEYIKGLDPDNNGAKRFIYAESTEDILALFPTSSGIYKKVSTPGDPSYGKSASVRNGETYTYSIRMQNDSSTKARDIAILDSIENYRTVNGKRYNYGIKNDRGWHGTLQGFDLQGVENKIKEYISANPSSGVTVDDLKVILYVGKDENTDIVDLDSELYSDSNNRQYLLYKILGNETAAEAASQTLTEEQKTEYNAIATKWKVVSNWRDLSTFEDLDKVSAFIVYTGEKFILDKDDSISFTVSMKAPDNITYDLSGVDASQGKYLLPPLTYNNVYRSFTNSKNDSFDESATYFYTHYDYTQVRFATVGTLRFTKTDANTNKPIPNVKFSLTGVSDYGTPYNETLASDEFGVVSFSNLELGTYSLIESQSDDDHLLDSTPRTVRVEPTGKVTIVTVDGVVIEDASGNYTIKNKARNHGTFEFKKLDSITKKGVMGAKFRLTGVSDHNTQYDIEVVSDANGVVSFGDIEKGTYTLTETAAAEGYLPPVNNTYTVTSAGYSPVVFTISGENTAIVNSQQAILNVPLADMTVQKMDSITRALLDDAKFTLTAANDLNSTIENFYNKAAQQYSDKTEAERAKLIRWTQQDGKWVQIVDGINNGIAGQYYFANLPEGTYTLTEERLPTGHTKSVTEYTVRVEKDDDLDKYVISFDPQNQMEYTRITDGRFESTDKENAEFYTLFNDPTYEDTKTTVKSWVGGTGKDGEFPKLHLSNDTPAGSPLKVTISSTLKSIISVHKSDFTGFVFDENYPEDKIECIDRTGDAKNEKGLFYAWWSDADNKVHWWSDANIIYFPVDCSDMFKDCNSANLKELDFTKPATPFKTSKTTNMSGMFSGCTNLEKLDISTFETSNVTDMSYMFYNDKKLEVIKLDKDKFVAEDKLTTVEAMFSGCNKLGSIDLRGFGNCENLTTIKEWFRKCFYLKYIDLTNFSTSNKLATISYAFSHAGTGSKEGTTGIDPDVGTSVFAKGKWNTASSDRDDTMDDYFRINLYNTVYKNAPTDATNYPKQGDPVHLDVTEFADLTQGIANPGSNNRRVKYGYFNSADSDYYREVCALLYGTTDSNSVNSPINSPFPISDLFSETVIRSLKISDPNDSFDGYSPVTEDPQEDYTITYPRYLDLDDPTGYEAGYRTYSFEYVTDKTGTAVEGEENAYIVKETLYMYVNDIIEKDGKLCMRESKFEYDTPLTAKWTRVTRGSTSQWYCEFTVNNGDEQFYYWETPVEDYSSSATRDNAVISKTRTDKPVVTNATDDTPVGDLYLKKTLSGTDSTKYDQESFWFKVTMKNSDNTAYTMLPFNSSGVAYFEVMPNVSDKDLVKISGIPEGCTYTVEEVDEPDHEMPEGYTKVTSTVNGTISSTQPKTASIENSIDTTKLSLTKAAELWKKTAGNYKKVTDPEYNDLIDWLNEEFEFTVSFINLVKDHEYSYKIDGTTQSDKIVGNSTGSLTTKTLKIKPGQTVEFIDLPTTTKYSVTENTVFEDTENESYEVNYQINDGETVSGSLTTPQNTLGNSDETVVFTNIKKTDRPESVSFTVKKEWYSSSGDLIEWTEEGSPIGSDSNYPSFLKVYIGRTLKYEKDGNIIYLDNEASFTSDSLKSKNAWTWEFTDLPKYGTVTIDGVEVTCPYVYYVSEVVPIGFENCNDPSELQTLGSGKYYTANEIVPGKEYAFTLKNKKIPTYELTIAKLVEGDLGSKTTDFTFEITFKKDGKPLKGTGITLQFRDLFDPSFSRNRTYTIENGKLELSLPHGRYVKFLSLPDGLTYTITEKEEGSQDYIVTSGLYTAESPVDANRELLTSERTNSGTLDEDKKILYINTRNGDVPTGIRLSSFAVLFALIAAAGGLIFFIKKRAKLTDEED